MVTTKEGYVELLKACCREIIDRADEFMPEPEFRTQVKFVINFSVDAMPHIEVSQIFVPMSTVSVINRYMTDAKDRDDEIEAGNGEVKKDEPVRKYDATRCGGMGSIECETCDMPCVYR